MLSRTLRFASSYNHSPPRPRLTCPLAQKGQRVWRGMETDTEREDRDRDSWKDRIQAFAKATIAESASDFVLLICISPISCMQINDVVPAPGCLRVSV